MVNFRSSDWQNHFGRKGREPVLSMTTRPGNAGHPKAGLETHLDWQSSGRRGALAPSPERYFGLAPFLLDRMQELQHPNTLDPESGLFGRHTGIMFNIQDMA
jgi:hypothetical protein